MSTPPSQYRNPDASQTQEQRRGQSQERPREQEQSAEQSAEAPLARSMQDFSATPDVQPEAAPAKKSLFKHGTETRVAGKAGDKNITWTWTEVPLLGYNSCRYTFHTSEVTAWK